jgi:hypothetical protein
MKFDLKKILQLLKKIRLCVGKQAVAIKEVTDDATDKKIDEVANKIDDVIETIEAAGEMILPVLPPSPVQEGEGEEEKKVEEKPKE